MSDSNITKNLGDILQLELDFGAVSETPTIEISRFSENSKLHSPSTRQRMSVLQKIGDIFYHEDKTNINNRISVYDTVITEKGMCLSLSQRSSTVTSYSRSSNKGVSSDKSVSSIIDKAIQDEAYLRRTQGCSEVIIIGFSDSGAKTLMKQINILFGDGFNRQYRSSKKSSVLFMLISAFRVISTVLLEKNSAIDIDPKLISSLQLLEGAQLKSTSLPEDISEAMMISSCSDMFQNFRKNDPWKIMLDDAAGHFFDNLSRILKPDYCPTTNDILHLRSVNKKSCIIQNRYMIKNRKTNFMIYPSYENNKWFNYVEKQSSLLFVVSAASYCQNLANEPTINRLLYSLAKFESICAACDASKINVIITKVDLLESRMTNFQVRNYLPHYIGKNCITLGKNEPLEYMQFLSKQFSRYDSEVRKISIYRCHTTDTKQISDIMDSINF